MDAIDDPELVPSPEQYKLVESLFAAASDIYETQELRRLSMEPIERLRFRVSLLISCAEF